MFKSFYHKTKLIGKFIIKFLIQYKWYFPTGRVLSYRQFLSCPCESLGSDCFLKIKMKYIHNNTNLFIQASDEKFGFS